MRISCTLPTKRLQRRTSKRPLNTPDSSSQPVMPRAFIASDAMRHKAQALAEGRVGSGADLTLSGRDVRAEGREGSGVSVEGGADELAAVGALEEPVGLVVRAANYALLKLEHAGRVRDDGVVVDAHHLHAVGNATVSRPQRSGLPAPMALWTPFIISVTVISTKVILKTRPEAQSNQGQATRHGASAGYTVGWPLAWMPSSRLEESFLSKPMLVYPRSDTNTCHADAHPRTHAHAHATRTGAHGLSSRMICQ